MCKMSLDPSTSLRMTPLAFAAEHERLLVPFVELFGEELVQSDRPLVHGEVEMLAEKGKDISI